MSRYYSDSDSDDDVKKWAGRVAEGTCAAKHMQTRFKRIPDDHLNIETIAGIRDMNLGKLRKNGKPVGAATIRFDTGKNTGVNPHINFDPKGRKNAKNPHLEVPPGVIKGAEAINKILKYAGITLTVAAVTIDIWRIVSAFNEDLEIRKNANKIISELEDAIQKLQNKLDKESSASRRREIRDTIDHLKRVLRDVKRTKKVPVKFLKTTSSVGGGWGGGIAGGSAGAWGGAQAGTLFGAFFGPVGVVVGGPIGAIIGAVGCGIGGGYFGSTAGEAIADWGLQLADSD